MMVAVMAAYFEKSGAVQGFTNIVDKRKLSRKSMQLVSWLLGWLISFSDSLCSESYPGIVLQDFYME